MSVGAMLRRLLGPVRRLRTGRRRGETGDERAAKKYWDRQVAADHERRGVDEKHA